MGGSSPSQLTFVQSQSTIETIKKGSKVTIKIPERRHWHGSGLFIVNFEHISNLSSVSIVDFE